MTPEYLEIENLNSFTDTQVVDFTALAADRLFCICGDTGAGKTTVLDAVIIALYGIKKETTDARSGKDDFINLSADRARVSFSFRMRDGKGYRVERSYPRNGAGKVYLYEDGQLAAQGADAVNAAIESIVGLTRDEFTQVIILQQGAFSRFLSAKPGERTDTVSKLFKLSKFDLHGKVNKTVIELDKQLAELKGRLDPLETVTEKTVAEQKRQLKAYRKQAETLQEDEVRAAAQLLTVQEGKRKFDAYTAAEAERKRLEVVAQTAVAAYRAALEISPETLEENARRAEEQAREIATKREAFLRQKAAAETAAKLTAEREALREQYRKIEKAEQQSIERRDAAAATFEVTKVQAQEALIRAKAAAEACKLPVDDFAALGQTAAAEAARLKAAAATFDAETEKQADAKARLEILTAEIEQTEAMVKAALTHADACKHTYENERRAQATAAVLEGLHEGDACPVCGGVVHLRAVTSDVETAKQAWEKAEKVAQGVQMRYAEIAAELATVKKEATAVVVRPADFAPFVALAAAASAADKADKACAAAEKAFADLDGKCRLSAQEKENLLAVGREKSAHIDRYRAEAGACAEKDGAQLAAEEAAFVRAERDAQTAAVEAREKAKAAGETVKRLQAEKAKAEGEYAAAVRAVVEAPEVTVEAVSAAELALSKVREARETLLKTQTEAETRCRDDESKLAEKKVLTSEKRALDLRRDTAETLAKLMKDKALVKFVAEEYIRAFTAAASVRLNALSGGKYTLSYEDGTFSIGDFLNGNSKRRVVTLSGGETFLASLSMAAAISDMLAESVSYGFFFLDEGFGTLDESKLDSVYEALITLSADTMVGVVTHSRQLIERIPARITVLAADGTHGSRIV